MNQSSSGTHTRSQNEQQTKPACHACGITFNWGDKFCANCGRSFTKKKTKLQDVQDVPFVHKQQSDIDQYNSILVRKSKSRSQFAWIFLFVGVALVFFVPIAGGISILLAIFIALSSSGLSENEYYSITGSKDGNQRHRCIFCGNKGIYRHTIYKTNTTLADCSKCGKNLFRS